MVTNSKDNKNLFKKLKPTYFAMLCVKVAEFPNISHRLISLTWIIKSWNYLGKRRNNVIFNDVMEVFFEHNNKLGKLRKKKISVSTAIPITSHVM